jgi:hypothetical protein
MTGTDAIATLQSSALRYLTFLEAPAMLELLFSTNEGSSSIGRHTENRFQGDNTKMTGSCPLFFSAATADVLRYESDPDCRDSEAIGFSEIWSSAFR